MQSRATVPSISIVVPAYNEAARIEASIRAIGDYSRACPMSVEVVVVDDGSRDDTIATAERAFAAAPHLEARVLHYARNRGKGFAVRFGLLAAKAPIALFSDADLSTPIEELPKLVDRIVDGRADLTFGSRALDRSLVGVHQSKYREMGGRAFNMALRLATGLPYLDTQCGFKAFRMSVCRPLIEAGTIDGFGFDIELLYEAHHAGLRLREVPVRWNHCEGSKVRFLRDGTRMLRDVVTVRKRGAHGLYDHGMQLAGLAAQQDRLNRVASVRRDALA